jgi:RES domain-containing protein
LRVYRIAKEKPGRYRADDLSGNGAALSGGRWNARGTPVLYTSANASTAVLETRVHATGILPRANLFLVTIDVPDQLLGAAFEPALPPDWNLAGISPQTTVEIGQAWITQANALAMKVPSVVCPADFNYMLNPRHPDMRDVAVIAADAFELDPRLFR